MGTQPRYRLHYPFRLRDLHPLRQVSRCHHPQRQAHGNRLAVENSSLPELDWQAPGPPPWEPALSRLLPSLLRIP